MAEGKKGRVEKVYVGVKMRAGKAGVREEKNTEKVACILKVCNKL